MLRLEHLAKYYGDLCAVEDVTFSIKRGETIAIMGPSGCGKSTTIRMINKTVVPDSGRVIFEGDDVLTLSTEALCRVRRRIGFVFQAFHLIRRLTVLDNVILGLVMEGMEREKANMFGIEALEKVGMEGRRDDYPDALSGGQMQRVAIARAIAARPPLMLWDEPTASLDPILVREVLVIMEELARYRAAAMIVVTHELPFALRAADRILLMDSGRIVEEGSPQQIFTCPRSAVGRQYQALAEYQFNTQHLYR